MNVPLSINVQTTFLVVKFPHKKEGFVWSSRLRTARKPKKKKAKPNLVDQGGNTSLIEELVQRRHSCIRGRRLADAKGRKWTEMRVWSESRIKAGSVCLCVQEGSALFVVGVQSMHVNYRCQS